MTGVLLRARAEMKARWRVWLSLTLMLGIFGGAVMAIAAGARRTDSAYPRFLAWSRAFDVAVPHFPKSLSGGVFGEVQLRDVEALPQVESSARLRIYSMAHDTNANAPADDRFGTTSTRLKYLEGRAPRAVNEIALNWLQAERAGLHVGDTVPETFIPANRSGLDHPLRLRMRVAGIEAGPGGFPPFLTDTPAIVLSRAFDRKYQGVIEAFNVTAVRLQRGFADIPPFLDEVRRLSDNKALFTLRQDTQAANVERSFHLQAIALWLLAALTGVVALLVVGQVIARQTFLESNENPVLSSLGMTRSQLLAVALLRVAGVAVVGATIAVIVAALASSLFPTGLARVAEPSPGFRLDPLALGLGALAILLLVGVLAAIPAWRAATAGSVRTETSTGERPSAVAAAFAKTGVSASGIAGMRMALERGRGRTAVPVRTAIAGVTVGIAALSAALTFGASLTHLLDTPSQYGVTWNLQVYANVEFATKENERQLVATVRDDPDVAAYSLGTLGLGLLIDGKAAEALALYNEAGSVMPPILSGRAPSATGEIALGPKTLDQLHKEIGDEVMVSVFGSKPKPMRVVGEAVTSPVGDVGRFGKGALIDYRSAQYLVPGAPAADTLLVRTVPGADPKAVGREIRAKLPEDLNVEITEPIAPSDLVNFGRVQNFPLFLAALVAAMAAATLAHVLVTSIRRRRRDLAILKTLGFQKGQLTSTVAWQATTLVLVALLIGIPLGVAAGRWIWTTFADNLGIVPSPAVPLPALLITIPATLLLANLIAYLPGRAAGRVQAATVLRTE